MKPHVLHVINNLNVSGATSLLLDVATCIASQGETLSVCTIEPENPMAGAFQSLGVRVHAPKSRCSMPAAARFVHRVISHTSPDIIHTHLVPATQYGCMAAKLAHKTVVTTVHYLFSGLKANRFLQQINKLTHRLPDHLFAVSDAVKESIITSCRVPQERVTVIRSGIDFNRSSMITPEMRVESRARFGIDEGEFVIGCVGRLEQVKGHHLLLQAFARMNMEHSNVCLLLAGDGPCANDLMRHAVDLNISENVIFAGTQKDTVSCLAALDLFVLPSLSEGLGLALIEAMGAGLPVVGSTAGGIPEIISDDETGLLFEKGNIDSLTAALRRMLTFDDQRKRLAAAARAAAWTRFSIDRYVERLYRRYEELVCETTPYPRWAT